MLTAKPEAMQGLDEEPLYEVIDGQRLELKSMGAYEAWLASILEYHLSIFVNQDHLGWTGQEMLFNLPAVQRQRRPDVAFVSYARWPRQRRVPRLEAWDVVPNLAIEVVSPTNKGDEVVDKIAEYFRAGVESVWVVFPSQELVYVYASPTAVRIFTRADVLEGAPVLPDFHLPLDQVFDGIQA